MLSELNLNMLCLNSVPFCENPLVAYKRCVSRVINFMLDVSKKPSSLQVNCTRMCIHTVVLTVARIGFAGRISNYTHRLGALLLVSNI